MHECAIVQMDHYHNFIITARVLGKQSPECERPRLVVLSSSASMQLSGPTPASPGAEFIPALPGYAALKVALHRRAAGCAARRHRPTL
jgi:hypothetical protein